MYGGVFVCRIAYICRLDQFASRPRQIPCTPMSDESVPHTHKHTRTHIAPRKPVVLVVAPIGGARRVRVRVYRTLIFMIARRTQCARDAPTTAGNRGRHYLARVPGIRLRPLPRYHVPDLALFRALSLSLALRTRSGLP